MKKAGLFVACVIGIVLMLGETTFAQTTEFTYQGRLLSGGVPANGSHDFEFRLFDDAVVGAQLGPTVTLSAVNVNNGVFSVRLDFGNQFPGANRFLEIRVKATGDEFFTVLSPRQGITSAPYSIKSLNAESANNSTNSTTATNALQLNGVPASQYVLTGDARLSDARNPLPTSPSYIQNRTTTQALSNFNISGNGTVGGTLTGNIVNAGTQFNLGGFTVLSIAGINNTFAGPSAGAANTGTDNSFFGSGVGVNNTGSENSFFGSAAGSINNSGSSNSFFGDSAGKSNGGGTNNTIIGANANVGNGNLTNATAVGANALVTQSNSLVLGSGANVGIGTSAPQSRLHVVGNALFTTGAGVTNRGNLNLLNSSGNANFYIEGGGSGKGINFGVRGSSGANATLFIAQFDGSTYLDRLIITSNGTVQIPTLGSAGSTTLCRNSANEISTCSSSIRYKSNIKSFSSGLSLIKELRPVSFNWKEGGMPDLGLVAEEVNRVNQLLITTNDKGDVEGVKYDRLGVVLVNAVKEQQTQIEAQQKQIQRQQEQIEALKKLICKQNAQTEVCRRGLHE